MFKELLSALKELEHEADLSLDYRPSFRRAIANAHAVIAQAEQDDYEELLWKCGINTTILE